MVATNNQVCFHTLIFNLIYYFFLSIKSIYIYISAELSINMLSKESKISILVGDMVGGASAKHIVHIRAHKVGDRNIIIKVLINKLSL